LFVCFFNYTNTTLSFAAAFRGKTEENIRNESRQGAVAGRSYPQPLKAQNKQELAALRGTRQQNKRQNIRSEVVPAKSMQEVSRIEQHERDQSVRAPAVNSTPVDNMFRAVSLVQHITTEPSGAESEEARTMAIAKLVSYITAQHGH
jgi:hypothetical protein